MHIQLHPDNPQPREIKRLAELLSNHGVIIVPTDSVYAFVCDSDSSKGIDKLCALTGKKPEQANLSMLFHSLSQVSAFTVPVSNEVFRLMKRNIPGPFTFILKANSQVPKLFRNTKKKTLGVRIPDNSIVQALLEAMGRPLVAASLHPTEGNPDFLSDADEIHDLFEKRVDAVVESGPVGLDPSAVIDVSEGEVVIIREGARELLLG